MVPVFNRETLIRRCLDSCLSQMRPNVEIVVVDDASTDETVQAIHAIGDLHIRLFVQDENRGVSAARGRGVREARGPWIAFLDSDDELAEGSLDKLLAAIASCPDEFGAIYHREIHDDGSISPESVVKFGTLYYPDFISLLNLNRHSKRDIFQCMRASALREVPWPVGRAPETEFHLNFIRRFPALFIDDILYKVHHDADARLSLASGLSQSGGRAETDRLLSLERIIDIHGDALREYGPAMWEHLVANLLSLELIFGRKAQARDLFSYGFKNGANRFLLIGLYVLGWVGPGATSRLRLIYKTLKLRAVPKG